MFTGEYNPNLDEKGRIALPARVRKQWRDDESIQEWVFTYGYDYCIMGMPLESWRSFVDEKIAKLSRSIKENRKRIRFLLSGAYESLLDKQGRFILPNNLKDYANLKKDIVIIGVGDFIEIWDKDRYQSEASLDQAEINEFASEFWD